MSPNTPRKPEASQNLHADCPESDEEDSGCAEVYHVPPTNETTNNQVVPQWQADHGHPPPPASYPMNPGNVPSPQFYQGESSTWSANGQLYPVAQHSPYQQQQLQHDHQSNGSALMRRNGAMQRYQPSQQQRIQSYMVPNYVYPPPPMQHQHPAMSQYLHPSYVMSWQDFYIPLPPYISQPRFSFSIKQQHHRQKAIAQHKSHGIQKKRVTHISIPARLSPSEVSLNSYSVRNVVCNFSLPFPIDLRTLCLASWNCVYYKNATVLTKALRHPRCHVRVYSSGKVYIVGCKSEKDSRKAARSIGRQIQTAMNKKNEVVHMQNFRISNILATCKVPFGVMIQEMARKYQKSCEYEPELTVGAVWRSLEPRAVLRIHTTGTVSVTGATSEKSVWESINKIYPYIKEFCCVLDKNQMLMTSKANHDRACKLIMEDLGLDTVLGETEGIDSYLGYADFFDGDLNDLELC